VIRKSLDPAATGRSCAARLRQRGGQRLALRQPCEKNLADISLREENSPEPHDLAIMMALPAQEAKGQSNPQ